MSRKKNVFLDADTSVEELVYGADVIECMQRCGLNASDVGQASNIVFLGKRDAAGLTGVVGLEIQGDFALLRSLAVIDAARGRGLGKSLAKAAEHYAIANDIKRLFLLTMNAAAFFTSLGYGLHPRSEAPALIASTSQFSSLCPLSSIFMSKSLFPHEDQLSANPKNEQ